MLRDRTSEFQMIASQSRQRLAASGGAGALALTTTPSRARSSNPTSSREFNALAGQIGAKVSEVAQKLAHLTDLAKRTTNFDDNTAEINGLISTVKDEIKGLNDALSHLSTLQPQSQHGPFKQAGEHAESVVGVLRSNLMKTTAEFESALHLQVENMKRKQDRRSQFCSSNVFADYRGDPTFYQTSLPRRRQSPARADDSSDVIMEVGDLESQSLLAQDEYSDSRATAVQNINEVIRDLGNIFQQLATMVSQQQEQIERIDNNVEEALHQVEDGHAQLLKYMKTISSNRPLILKTFAAIIITMLLFIMFS